jgi:hypothetical protein
MSGFLKKIGNVVYQNSPQLLSGLACAGVITTTVLGIKAAPKIQELRVEGKAGHLEEFSISTFKKSDTQTKLDMLKALGKIYWPTITSGSITIGCIIASQHISSKRAAALASLYSLSKEALHTYQEKVIEEVGENTERKIRNQISQEKINEHPVDNNKVIITGRGEVLCYDPMIDRYFTSDYETIRGIINDLNFRLITEMFISLNEFYEELGLGQAKVGEDLGWYIEGGKININFDTMLSTDNRPCIVLEYEVAPKSKYF